MRLKPDADLNDDCVVDYEDLDTLLSDWLLIDAVIAVSVYIFVSVPPHVSISKLMQSIKGKSWL